MSAGGRKLGLRPSVISASIRRLEEHLHVTLLHRTTRETRLTEAGRAFYERAVDIAEQIRNAESLAGWSAAAPHGAVKVLASPHIARVLLSPYLIDFWTRYPRVTMEVEVIDVRQTAPCCRGADVWLGEGPPPSGEAKLKRLAPWPRYFLASASYLLQCGCPASLNELKSHRLLTETAGPWTAEGPEGTHILEPPSIFVSNSTEVVQSALLADLGIAFASPFGLQQEMSSGAVGRILTDYQGSNMNGLWAVVAAVNRHPVVDLVVEYFSDVLRDGFKLPTSVIDPIDIPLRDAA